MSLSIQNSYGQPDWKTELNKTPIEKELDQRKLDGKLVKSPLEENEEKKSGKSNPSECETCKNRKYKDGSDEMVSFKSAQHIPQAAVAGRVRAHEQEHVSNAYKKAETGNGKVLQASVSIQTAVCPECGRSYVSGGTTTTRIAYYNEDNPYQKDLKTQDASKYTGMNVDLKG